MTERVLVLPRTSVPGGCDFRGIRDADAAYLQELRAVIAAEGRYLERAATEVDATHKQLIPYVIVRDAGAVFLMQRTEAGGDARLRGKASIGVGGHLNPVDDGVDALMAGLRREWEEELDAPWEPEFELVGLLNDDSNPVGSVHLGVVFSVNAGGRSVEVREQEKLSGEFVELGALREHWDQLETWSQLVADRLVGTHYGTHTAS